MKLHPWSLALALAGCGLVNSNTLSYDYSFDAQEFMQKVGDEHAAAATVPQVACDPTAAQDACASPARSSRAGSAQLSCDATTHTCSAVIDVLAALSGRPVDAEPAGAGGAVRHRQGEHQEDPVLGHDQHASTSTSRPSTSTWRRRRAKTEGDPSAKKLGTVAKLPMHSSTCTDPADGTVDGLAACDISLTSDGQAALAAFVKDYKTPFQFIAHTEIIAHGGDPLPVGTLDFFVQPTVSFSILK